MTRNALLAALAALIAAPAGAQALPEGPRVAQALAYLERSEPATVEEQIALCQIEAPPFKEARRAADYQRRMTEAGVQGVHQDAEGNVIGMIPGTAPDATAVVISGHLDTVFPEGTDVTVRRTGTLLRGPGIEDDCRGLAAVLAAARAFRETGIRPRRTIYFVGTVGEEGPGNLRGVRALFAGELRARTGYFISVDGGGWEVVREAVASHRYRVTFAGPGGHSYGDFGMPNPAHAMGRAIGQIADFQVPTDPKVTFNVGMVSGGTSVNSIAQRVTMEVDMRSSDQAALRELDARFQSVIRQAVADENARWEHPARVTLQVDTIGIRPGGGQPESAAIVQAVLRSAQRVGGETHLSPQSTDANVPISLGIPAITMGSGGSGSGAHSLLEQWDSAESHRGTQWVFLTLLTLAQSGGS